MRPICILLSSCTIALAACGDDEPDRTAAPVDTPPPSATATVTASPAAEGTSEASPEGTVTLPVQTPTPDATSAPGGESGEGGAGDEKPMAVDLRVTVDGEGVKPAVLRVAPTLPFNLILRNDLPARLTVEFDDEDISFIAEPHSTHTRYVSGLPRGRYTFQVAHLDEGVIEVR